MCARAELINFSAIYRFWNDRPSSSSWKSDGGRSAFLYPPVEPRRRMRICCSHAAVSILQRHPPHARQVGEISEKCLTRARVGLCDGQVTCFYENGAAFTTEGSVSTQMRTAYPGPGSVAAELILKDAFQHINLLTAVMSMGIEPRPRRPAHQSGVLAAELRKGQHRKTRHKPCKPGGLAAWRASTTMR